MDSQPQTRGRLSMAAQGQHTARPQAPGGPTGTRRPRPLEGPLPSSDARRHYGGRHPRHQRHTPTPHGLPRHPGTSRNRYSKPASTRRQNSLPPDQHASRHAGQDTHTTPNNPAHTPRPGTRLPVRGWRFAGLSPPPAGSAANRAGQTVHTQRIQTCLRRPQMTLVHTGQHTQQSNQPRPRLHHRSPLPHLRPAVQSTRSRRIHLRRSHPLAFHPDPAGPRPQTRRDKKVTCHPRQISTDLRPLNRLHRRSPVQAPRVLLPHPRQRSRLTMTSPRRQPVNVRPRIPTTPRQPTPTRNSQLPPFRPSLTRPAIQHQPPHPQPARPKPVRRKPVRPKTVWAKPVRLQPIQPNLIHARPVRPNPIRLKLFVQRLMGPLHRLPLLRQRLSLSLLLFLHRRRLQQRLRMLLPQRFRVLRQPLRPCLRFVRRTLLRQRLLLLPVQRLLRRPVWRLPVRVLLPGGGAHAQLAGGRHDQRPRRKSRSPHRKDMHLHIRRPHRSTTQLIDPLPGIPTHPTTPRHRTRRAHHPVHIDTRRHRRQTAVLPQQRPRLPVRHKIHPHRRRTSRPTRQHPAQPLPRHSRVPHRRRNRPRQREIQTPPTPVSRQPTRQIHQQRTRSRSSRTQPRQHRIRIPHPVQSHHVSRNITPQQHTRRHHRQRAQIHPRIQLHHPTTHSNIPRHQQNMPPPAPRPNEIHEQTVLTPHPPPPTPPPPPHHPAQPVVRTTPHR